LNQVKCDYVTISGKFGVEKLFEDHDKNLFTRISRRRKNHAIKEEVEKSNQNIIGINKENRLQYFKVVTEESNQERTAQITDK